MTLIDTVKDKITTVQQELENALKIKSFLESLPSTILETLPNGYMYGDGIDFDNLSHNKVIEVVRLLGGRWDKTPSVNDARINYSATINGIKFRCYSGEPPPNCKIVEEQVVVPATPERTVTRKRLVCTEQVTL
jgi:hypothetical protein